MGYIGYMGYRKDIERIAEIRDNSSEKYTWEIYRSIAYIWRPVIPLSVR